MVEAEDLVRRGLLVRDFPMKHHTLYQPQLPETQELVALEGREALVEMV